MEVTLTLEKETKNTVRYSTDQVDAPINTLYISKAAAASIGNPRTITVRVEAAR